MKNGSPVFIFVLAIIFALFLAGCGDATDDNKTSLAINNLSDYDLLNVEYSGVEFGSIASGKDISKGVNPGSKYIFFSMQIGNTGVRFRIEEIITCEEGKKKPVNITNNTVVATTVDERNGTLKSLFGALTAEKNQPQITVKRGNAVISQNGDYDFRDTLINTTKEITFIIENSGLSDLSFEPVNGNRINLSNNTAGHFSVNLQPLSPTVVSGDSTTFSVRFSPTELGNNFAADVQITTNSKNYAEFAFRVRGNGSNSNSYQVGDTGPGGGTIFYAQGGQYKECSGELGTYAWSAASSTANNYRGGGFDNWKLPDTGELDLMYYNLHKNGFGDFFDAAYWTSTISSSNSFWRWTRNFSTGEQSTRYNDDALRTRAVRSFGL